VCSPANSESVPCSENTSRFSVIKKKWQRIQEEIEKDFANRQQQMLTTFFLNTNEKARRGVLKEGTNNWKKS
jgi:hypothetical protein